MVGIVAPQAEAAVLKNEKAGISFSYDENVWDPVPQSQIEGPRDGDADRQVVEQTLAGLSHKVAEDKYHTRFSVVRDNLANLKGQLKGKSPSEQLLIYQKHAVDFMKSQRFRILSSEMIRLPNVKVPGIEILADQRDFGLTFRQIVFLKDGEAFLLTAAARSKSYPKYQPELEKIFNSFSFSK